MRKTFVNVSPETSTGRITGAALRGSFLNLTKEGGRHHEITM